MEMTVFTCFLLIQIAAKTMPVAFERIAHLVIVQRIARHHWVVWLGHPVVLHAIHEYTVHIIVYSGYVLKAH